MGNSLRCCLACVLPFGALDLIRIVHLNGHVQEITHPVMASEILKVNPDHVLTKPFSQGFVRQILILSPDSELKRGSIYFLIPSSSLVLEKKNVGCKNVKRSANARIRKSNSHHVPDSCDRYLTDRVASVKKHPSRHVRRQSGHGRDWQPHLQSIHED